MKTVLQTIYMLALFCSLLIAQPVINGDMSDVSYNSLSQFTSARIGAGSNNDLNAIKFYADGTNLYLGITGEISGENNILLFFDFSGYRGRGSNTLGAGTTGAFANIGGAKMDFDVDYALEFTENSTDNNLFINGCRYRREAPTVSDAAVGQTANQNGAAVSFNLGAVFGGVGNIQVGYDNGYASDNNKGLELKIPIDVFAGVNSTMAFRVFVVIGTVNGYFYNESIPGDPGASSPGMNPDFSAIADQKFYSAFAPLVRGITFEGLVDFYYPSSAWMGDLLDDTPFFHNVGDGSCVFWHCGNLVDDCGTYAYQQIVWNSSGDGDGCSWNSGHANYCNAVVENTDFLNNVNNITLTLNFFQLSATQHRNWGAPEDGPNGIMGDHRVYSGGIGIVSANGDWVLVTENNRLSVDIEYPAPYGTGDYSIGDGMGNISLGYDPNWENTLNNGNNQVTYGFYSFSPVVQSIYGAFEFTVILKEGNVVENFAVQDVEAGVSYPLAAPGVKVNVDAAELTYGTKRVLARESLEDAGGTLPIGVDAKTDYNYWELGTTCESITSDVTFDITDIPNITNTDNLVILKRESSYDDWEVWGNITLPGAGGLTANEIRANDLLTYSEFALGSTGGNALPVELQAFRGTVSDKNITLNWQTATEKNNYGFEVERKIYKTGKWETLGFVNGHGNSNSTKNYSFVDDELPLTGKYYYRLKQMDTNGKYEYSAAIMFELNKPASYNLMQNYPNPFNPSTTITYQLPEDGRVKILIYDMLGRLIKELVNEEIEAGIHEVEFNANSLASGTYIYQLQAGGKVMINKKMLLLK